ncbi:MAG: DUF1285 domain-containing protein [Brevundimonas sp.]|jgi:uncharacterized protein|uniref:DUF1285 domain-containing protein n=1 Tax=unclassified Brevundimonas TaxID=2622653 RepID=UPI0006FBDD24|nr:MULTISPECIES: DUF1285 domain-containing protein [unclassified Brevundimonas]KQP48248.1 hypothetical protein ASF31_02635 [Brevundimonas sp. Leaf280]
MDNPKSGLNAVAEAAKQAPGKGLPPVHLWHPAHCGDIDIVIRADGVWMHEGSPIGRKELVRLFSTVLRKDPDGYHLVTPVEKLKITVEDLPFRAVAMRREGDALIFTTDVGDEVRASEADPIVVETDPTTGEPAPRIHVRRDLWARIARSVFYEMVEMAQEVDGRLVVRSGGQVFSLGAVT